MDENHFKTGYLWTLDRLGKGRIQRFILRIRLKRISFESVHSGGIINLEIIVQEVFLRKIQ